MTHQATKMLESLLKDLRDNPQVSPIEAIQAAILGARKFEMPSEDLRGMLTALRAEYGVGEQRWSAWIVFCLRNVPDIGDGTIKELSRPT